VHLYCAFTDIAQSAYIHIKLAEKDKKHIQPINRTKPPKYFYQKEDKSFLDK